MTCRYTSVENTLQLAADDVTIIVSAAEPLPKENLKGAVSAPNGTLPTDEEKQYVRRFNPLYSNGFFLLIWYNKLGIVHCTYIGVSGYNFPKILYSFVWRSFLPQWFYLAIFMALYGSHSQSKKGLYFPSFMYFSTYFSNFNKIFSQIRRKLPKIPNKITVPLQTV